MNIMWISLFFFKKKYLYIRNVLLDETKDEIYIYIAIYK